VRLTALEAEEREARRPPAQSCECGGKLGCLAMARRAKRWFKRRPKHDLCNRCYVAERDRMAAKTLRRPASANSAASFHVFKRL